MPPSSPKAFAMPAAAKIMADNNVPAGGVPGTGRDGRVTKGDVIGALASGVIAKAAAAPMPSVAPAATARPALTPVAAPVGAIPASASIGFQAAACTSST